MTDAIATIIIPYAPYHADIVERAIKSAHAQTIRCNVLALVSPDTPARARNRGMYVDTPFVVFLDADDILHPPFVAECLLDYQEGKYVYTSWAEGAGQWVYKPKDCAWSGNTYHIVTTLYPTALFKDLGGFDETLPGHEDADFYMRSYAHGICGVHCDKPLVLRPDDTGQRSKDFHARADYQQIIEDVALRNGGMARIMACCGNSGEAVASEPGAGLPGDVLAESLWNGMRTEYSPYTQRKYIGGNGTKIMVSPTDIEKLKDVQGRPLFRATRDPRELAPKREQVLKAAGLT